MIIARSPLRISLGGGGTDLPSYYREHEGFLIAAAIDKHVYITVHEPFTDDIMIKYSKLEVVKSVDQIQHPIIREALRINGIKNHIEIAALSDIPAGTGLGSSGSFTTALLKAIHTFLKAPAGARELAEQACHIEMNLLNEPIGKQDQYIAAFGGLTSFYFHADDTVEVCPLRIATETLHNLEDNLMLFFTGFTRKASEILRDQDARSRANDPEVTKNLREIKQLGIESKNALERGDLRRFAESMHLHWERKKQRNPEMSNSRIDECYQLARKNGALGGKLIGAGGGGFLMFYTEDKTRLRRVMTESGLRELRFRFDFTGTHVVAQS